MESQIESVTARIRAALQANRGEEVVREITSAVSHGVIPARGEALAWLRKNLGSPAADAVVHAFASHPCFYCEHGLQPCESCDGAGHFGPATVCDFCLGLGRCSCGFCNGTGLLTYQMVPPSLRPPVIHRRVNHALREIKRMMSAEISAAPETTVGTARKELFRALIALDRLMGVLENAIETVKPMGKGGPAIRKFAAGVIRLCRRTARPVDQRMRQILQRLNAVEQAAARKADSADKRKLAMRRAELFASLAQRPGFASSMLQHPFLKL